MNENENTEKILSILSKIDLLINIVDDLSDDIDEATVSDDYLKLVGSPSVFDILRSTSQLKAVLHNMTANMMEASRTQSLIEKDNNKKLTPADRKVSQDLADAATKELSEDIDNNKEEDNNISDQENKSSKNKHIGNAIDYFRDKLEEDEKENE